ncbi:MAG TPA: hypothetical protein VFN64_05690 [Burkholderiaceae bacterium]|nr:hypothetical protein [Burkholderiaceae bacterium]
MGFITEEWISPGIKTGNYAVARVSLVPSRPSSEFSKRHGLVMRLKAERPVSNDHQVVHFDSSDLLQFLVCSLREVGPELRDTLVSALHREMSDDELVSALDSEISRRRPREATAGG